jgi:hypothetical protein
LATGISTRLSENELKRFLPALLGSLAVVLTGFSLLAPGRLGPVQNVWMRGAHALGWFNTRILLSLVYFLIMTPTGVVMRLLRWDPLHRRLGDGASYWVVRGQDTDPKGSMERQF